jgi:hypothetical protein
LRSRFFGRAAEAISSRAPTPRAAAPPSFRVPAGIVLDEPALGRATEVLPIAPVVPTPSAWIGAGRRHAIISSRWCGEIGGT